MTTTQDFLREIKKGVLDRDSELFKELIENWSTKHEKMKTLYNEYLGTVDILDKTASKTSKANNKIPNDFRGEIVDQGTSYLIGNPVTISIKENKVQNESQKTKIDEIIQKYITQNSFHEVHYNACENAGIMGYAALLMYKPTDNNVRIMNVMPYECIFLNDRSLDELQYVLRYYNVSYYNLETEKWEEKIRVEFYDKEKVTYYIENDAGSYEFILDSTEPVNPVYHGFNQVPLIKVENNRNELGDFEKTNNAIDCYDKLVSFLADESEQFRNSYLYTKGQGTTDEKMVKQAMEIGVFDLDENGEIGFILKNANTTSTENLIDILKSNIYRFSKTVDMSDEKFSGAGESGESRKWKLLNLIIKAKTKERHFIKALQKEFDLLFEIEGIKNGTKFDANVLEFSFTPNLPKDLKYESEVARGFTGILSQKTILSNVSIVSDVENEIEQLKTEKVNSGTAIVRQTLNKRNLREQKKEVKQALEGQQNSE